LKAQVAAAQQLAHQAKVAKAEQAHNNQVTQVAVVVVQMVVVMHNQDSC
jgi:hypothetical protein